MKRSLAILGSTGSIGTQALEVVSEHADLFEVYALTANNQVDLLINQARKYMPEVVVIANEQKYPELKEALEDLPIKVWAGSDAIAQVVQSEPIDMVLTAMVGYSGLKPTIAAIKAGKAMTIYHDLKLDKLDCTVAIIKNARSNKMGVKDIIKVECPIEKLDLDILGFIDHNITVNIIKDEKIVDKKELKLPKKITNVIKCKNPRCITSIEQGLDHVFFLADEEKEIYRCQYCEEKYRGKRNK